jgi:hypothetical protein
MAWVLVGAASVALATLVFVAVRNRTQPVDLENAVLAFRSLDIAAFQNLLDPAEDEFLRRELAPGKFREIKRQRSWAALTYAWEAGNAATGLARVGQAAQRSSDPAIAASGAQLAENSFRLRLQTLGACAYLLTEVLLPGLRRHARPSLADQYERASATLFRLGGFTAGVRTLARSEGA